MTYKEIMRSKDKKKWLKTIIQEEKDLLDKNKTLKLVNASDWKKLHNKQMYFK